MLTGFKRAAMTAAALSFTACGSKKEARAVYQKAAEECLADVITSQFVVKYTDGTTAVVQAGSEQEFLDGHFKAHEREIEFAEPDYRVRLKAGAFQPSSLEDINNWAVIRIDADELWRQGVRGDMVPVAVVDSGMDIQHPQLANQVYGNPGEQGVDASGSDRATNGVDDDGNGFIDDAGGWDFVSGRPLRADNASHGTHVAGIIAAAHSDTVAGERPYVQGAAPGAKILPLAFLDKGGSGALSDGVTAIKYAVSRGAKVINASWGGPICSLSLRDVIISLEQKGIAFIAAAGNDGVSVDLNKSYPASFQLAAQITVGATGEYDAMASYSNYGSESVDLFAPGTKIISTVPGGTASYSGTSMSTPFVAASVALLLSAEPSADIPLIRQALHASAIHRTDYINASQGRLNLVSALTELRRLIGK